MTRSKERRVAVLFPKGKNGQLSAEQERRKKELEAQGFIIEIIKGGGT